MTRNPLTRALRLALPLWRGMALAALLGALTIISSVSLMATSAWLISKASLQPSIAELSVAVVGVRFFGIARGVFRYLERLASHEVTFRLLARFRVGFYEALEPLAPARLAAFRSGDLLSRVIDDVESLQDLYLRAVAPPVVAVVVAVLLTIFLATFDATTALAALGFMLAAGVLIPLIAWRSALQSGQARVGTRADLNAVLVDQIQGMAESLVYGQTAAQFAALDALSNDLAAAERQTARADGLQLALSTLLASGAAVAVLWAAIPRVEGIYLATLTLATIAVFEAFTPLAQAAINLGAARNAAARLFEIVDAEPPVKDPRKQAPAPPNFRLDIQGLTFRYGPEEPTVLEDVNLSLKPGERIAILGASGAGKSTLANVLLRLWDYDEGQILLGGHDLRDYTQIYARAVFGVVTQRTHLFNTTIRANIRLARPSATDAEVEAAAARAQIHEFIEALPAGYDTLVGENGARLSGGERQRLALARAFLKDAPILLLDEATANLDTVTEQAIVATVLEATEGRSLLMLTHRRVMLERMDRVYMLAEKRLRPFEMPSPAPAPEVQDTATEATEEDAPTPPEETPEPPAPPAKRRRRSPRKQRGSGSTTT